MSEKLRNELHSFSGLWGGGYPNEIANTDNRQLGSVYDYCLRNTIKDKTVLEIGCGGGSWTRLMDSAKEIYAMDALYTLRLYGQ